MSDGIPFGLPSMDEVREAEAQRRRLRAKRLWQAKPWHTERPDPELERLRKRWPDGERLRWAWRLARDVETCGELIAGRAVSQERLDEDALKEAHQKTLIELRAPLELVPNITTEKESS